MPGQGCLSEDAGSTALRAFQMDELTHADRTALMALRDGRDVPAFAMASLERLLMRGLLDRDGLTPAGVKRADTEREHLKGISRIVAAPHKRDAAFERGRSWT